VEPIVTTIADYPVRRFTVLLDAGVVAGVAFAVTLARRRGVRAAAFLDVALVALAAAFVGARLQYVLAHWDEYAARPVNALNVWEGGLALPGAITLGALAAWAMARATGLPLGHVLDAAAPALALGQAVGRVGCVSAGCAFGAVVPEGAAVPALPLPDATGAVALRFPSQMVEAVGEVVLAGLLLALWARHPPPGTVAAAYLVGYAVLRAALEPLRGDSTFVLGVPLAQAWAIVAGVCGAAMLLVIASRRRRPPPATSLAPRVHEVAPPATV
jgi:phosphatidylglycerol:prolipoprotein diacylglycerol transferase